MIVTEEQNLAALSLGNGDGTRLFAGAGDRVQIAGFRVGDQKDFELVAEEGKPPTVFLKK